MTLEKVFRRLKTEKPHELDTKLAVVPGDVMLPLLGITTESAKLLANVSIIYHCAAAIRFDEPLRYALKLNVGGTLETIKFAQTLKKLKLFMHVSTFFSNPYLKKVEAKLYKAPMDWKFCLNLVERNDITDEQLNTITRKLIIGFPNTYTFTKNLAESLVNDYKEVIPVCIYRPSVVFFALQDPEPGFSPSFMGLMGLYAISGAGLLKTVYIDRSIRLDISPQDIVVKNMMHYTLKASQIYEVTKPQEIPVYITSNAKFCNLSLTEYLDIMDNFCLWEKAAYEKNLLLPGIFHTSNRFLYIFLVFVMHLLPAIIVDSVLKLLGRQPVLLRVQRKVFHTLEVMKPFMFNEYESDGITDFDELSKEYAGTKFSIEVYEEGTNLYTNVSFCELMAFSARELLFKEDPATLPRARLILKIKLFIYKFLQFLVLYKVYKMIIAYTEHFYMEWRKNKFCVME